MIKERFDRSDKQFDELTEDESDKLAFSRPGAWSSMKERFDRSNKQFDELTENIRVTNQPLAGVEHEARQPLLPTEADVEPETKTCKRTEGASAADRVKSGDSSSAMVDDGPTCSTSFGMIAELSALEKCIGDILVNKDTEGGILPAGTVFTAI